MHRERLRIVVGPGQTVSICLGHKEWLDRAVIEFSARQADSVAVRKFIVTHDGLASAMLGIDEESAIGAIVYAAAGTIDGSGNVCLVLAVAKVDEEMTVRITIRRELLNV